MPAEVNSMFSVREKPWHGLGIVLDDYPGRIEAMKFAGHDFRIDEKDVFMKSGKSGTSTLKVDGWKALVKSTDGGVMTVVRDSYAVVQNDVMWDIVDAIVKEPNVKYETAGVLKNGAVLWVLARIEEPTVVKGDDTPIIPYVLVSTSHDQSAPCKAQAVSVRVVCWNTYSMAQEQARGTGREYVFRHTKNVMQKIEDARGALAMTRDQYHEFLDMVIELGNHKITDKGVKQFVSRFIPEPPKDLMTDRIRTNIAIERVKFYDLLEGRSVPDQHRHTSYGLFCAGIEFLDHIRAYRTPETYFRRTMLDTNSMVKKKVAKLAVEVAV